MSKYTYRACAVMEEVKRAVIGKDTCIWLVMSAILARGHILIEDIPGVGKTTLALAFARSMGMAQHRVQFTPDVLPADITGFSMFDKERNAFVYQPGAVMCNLFLADEINRTSPKTQSALLEVMEEGRVTVDKITREAPSPFVVIATENPMGSAGTQPLPESQLDRFLICITMGYPDAQEEIEIIKGNRQGNPAEQIQPLMDAAELVEMQDEVEGIYIHDKVYNYIASLVTETRRHPMIRMGMSPRGTIGLSKMAKATAFLTGRDYCIPQDVRSVFPAVARHRIFLEPKARVNQVGILDVLEEITDKVPMPSPRKEN